MIYLIGAGGHAKVVLDALLVSGTPISELKIRDGDTARAGQSVLGVGIAVPELDISLTGAAFHVAIGSCTARENLYQRGAGLGMAGLTITHPAATLSHAAEIAVGCFVAAGAIIGPDARIGSGVIINHGAIIDHDCVVGDFSHIGPNATLGGAAKVGARVLVGAGAVILPGLNIGDDAVIGAGAVVTRDVGAGETWVGNPAAKRTA
jgi:sugar O-acyltransferase (sialic acid O-acetyltransferase NeuD family)